MTDWMFEQGDALTRQAWAKNWWIEAKTESYFYSHGFIGKDATKNIIVELPDLMKAQGDRITYGQVRLLTGAGVQGDNTMEGNEEEPDTFDDAVLLNQKRNAIRSKGKLSDQYPSDTGAAMSNKARDWARVLLQTWMADTIDQDLFTDLTTSPTKAIYGGDATSTASIEAGDYFDLSLISKCVAYSKKAQPKIMPVVVKGKKFWVICISPDQEFDMKERDAAWQQANREAQKMGDSNPIFSGATGVWNQTVIQVHERIALATTWGSGSNLNGSTGLFMGVSAGAIAYAKERIWNEKTFDFSNKVGFCIGSVYGTTKSVFNSADNALLAVRTYRTSN